MTDEELKNKLSSIHADVNWCIAMITLLFIAGCNGCFK